MNGARKYARMFKTGQYGRFYFVSGSHARGRTFYVFVLPAGADAMPNGENNPPRNPNAVEVYGVVSGNRGWTESYGWLHQGKWVDDFKLMVDARQKEIDEAKLGMEIRTTENEEQNKQRIAKLLSAY